MNETKYDACDTHHAVQKENWRSGIRFDFTLKLFTTTFTSKISAQFYGSFDAWGGRLLLHHFLHKPNRRAIQEFAILEQVTDSNRQFALLYFVYSRFAHS